MLTWKDKGGDATHSSTGLLHVPHPASFLPVRSSRTAFMQPYLVQGSMPEVKTL